MNLLLHNSSIQRKEPFVPLHPPNVSVYVCGPTVYDHPHVGNARPAVVFSLLVDLLRSLKYNVLFVSNITDSDDKIINAALLNNVPPQELAQSFANSYQSLMRSLGVTPPDFQPRVSESIPDIISFIQTLLLQNHAYVAENHVLFHVPSYPKYGSLSKRSTNEQIAGARIDVAPFKKHPADFVLWKPAKNNEPAWESPWGPGRPGWHVECSAMIKARCGDTIDIHAGGGDLLFPHHENEAAQSFCAHQKPLAQVWLHNGLVNLNGAKMAKSRGNLVSLKHCLNSYPHAAVRLALLSAHYRQPLEWSDKLLHDSSLLLTKIQRALPQNQPNTHPHTPAQPPNSILTPLLNDLDTPSMLRELISLAKKAADNPNAHQNTLARAASFLHIPYPQQQSIRPDAQNLLEAREKARLNKNFQEADRIRSQLEAMNFIVEDTPKGSRLLPKSHAPHSHE